MIKQISQPLRADLFSVVDYYDKLSNLLDAIRTLNDFSNRP